jgi:starch phosphorylase
LRVPLVAVGFMYPGGYVHQHIREDGWQESVGEPLDREAASISKVIGKNGKQIIIQVPFIEPAIHVAVWKIDVGRVPLYLMDTEIEQNNPATRKISEYLYIGDIEQRLRQEIVLGIGGSAVLQALGITHSVFHLNEGHAAFALLERVSWVKVMKETIKSNAPRFSAFRMVKEYINKFYVDALKKA